jgi:hypothetical protein
MARFEVYPFARLAPRLRKWALLGMLLLMIVISLIIARIGNVLFSAQTPDGILTLEFAATHAEAKRILVVWGDAGVAAARLQTQIDFAYLATYGIMIALACGLAVAIWAKRSTLFGWIGVALSWGGLAAALFDSVENGAILTFIGGGGSDALARLMTLCATLKFALVFAALCYALFGAAFWIGDRIIAIGKLWYRSVIAEPDEEKAG